MARLYAQLFALVFFVVGAGGLLVTALNGGSGGGDLGSLGLHLTWFRNAIDLGFLAAWVYVGFVASRHTGRIVVTLGGVLLLILGIGGFIVGDRGVADLHFGISMDIFDVAAGALAVLSGLGTIEDEAA
jgi:hypothetical protein